MCIIVYFFVPSTRNLMQGRLGTKWAAIAREMPGRTEHSVKGRFKVFLSIFIYPVVLIQMRTLRLLLAATSSLAPRIFGCTLPTLPSAFLLCWMAGCFFLRRLSVLCSGLFFAVARGFHVFCCCYSSITVVAVWCLVISYWTFETVLLGCLREMPLVN